MIGDKLFEERGIGIETVCWKVTESALNVLIMIEEYIVIWGI